MRWTLAAIIAALSVAAAVPALAIDLDKFQKRVGESRCGTECRFSRKAQGNLRLPGSQLWRPRRCAASVQYWEQGGGRLHSSEVRHEQRRPNGFQQLLPVRCAAEINRHRRQDEAEGRRLVWNDRCQGNDIFFLLSVLR